MIFVCIYIFFIYIKRTVILWSSLSTSCCWTVDGLPSKACFTCITSVLKVELTLLNITIQGLWEMLQIPYSLCLLNYFLFLLFILNGRKRLLYILQWMDEVFFSDLNSVLPVITDYLRPLMTKVLQGFSDCTGI